MKNKLFLKRFVIKKLFGIYDVDIPFESNINIYVGENGLGKTTILNALSYVLQSDTESLSTIDFKEIILTLGNNETVRIEKKNMSKENINNYSKNYYTSHFHDDEFIVNKIYMEMLREGLFDNFDYDDETKEKLFNNLLKKYKLDYSYSTVSLERIFNNILNDNSFKNEFKKGWEYQIYKYMKKWQQIIYLPTYRRIEEDFNSYIDSRNDRDFYKKARKKSNFSYLQFGMDDVQSAIDDACKTLKNNTNEGFKAMTSNLLTNYVLMTDDDSSFDNDIKNKKFEASKLNIVFSRLAEKIDVNVKERIISLVDGKSSYEDKFSKYLLSIINELNNIYETNMQIDNNLENFKNACNNYLVNKSVKYDKFKIECSVEQEDSKNEISLKNLSSGEKQILSLFSKLYLNSNDRNVILFDEPELSLSLLWQKKLIPDIIDSNRCGFIMVITHSPFIFDNEYKFNTRDIKDYITISR